MQPVLFSTNPFLKFFIHQKFYGDAHYVWCSEHFDRNALGRYSVGRAVPASSDPAAIYRQLRADVESRDRHSAKIAQQRASYLALAQKFRDDGRIDAATMEEVFYIVENAGFDEWRPLIYVIPRVGVVDRLQLVPIRDRAGFGNEHIIPDLARSEFDVIEI